MESTHSAQRQQAWNKGKLVGQKAPFKLKEIWAIRVRLQMQGRLRELALFNLGIDIEVDDALGVLPQQPKRLTIRIMLKLIFD